MDWRSSMTRGCISVEFGTQVLVVLSTLYIYQTLLGQERCDISLERRDTTQEPHQIRPCIHSAALRERVSSINGCQLLPTTPIDSHTIHLPKHFPYSAPTSKFRGMHMHKMLGSSPENLCRHPSACDCYEWLICCIHGYI
jgi:hypothetical protein